MRRTVLPAVAAIALLATACGGAPNPAVTAGALPGESAEVTRGGPTAGGGDPALYSGQISNATGTKVGSVSVSKGKHGMTVTVTAKAMPPGFHATHLHAIGKCEPKSPDPADPAKVGDFLSAGGHLVGSGTVHPTHAGDLPMLYVAADGTGALSAATDRLTDELLAQSAGVSMVVHAGADNYGNIPTRYASAGPDAETKKAGDAGGRIACSVLAKGGGNGAE